MKPVAWVQALDEAVSLSCPFNGHGKGMKLQGRLSSSALATNLGEGKLLIDLMSHLAGDREVV